MYENKYPAAAPRRAPQPERPIEPTALIRITKKGQRLLAAYEARRFKRAA